MAISTLLVDDEPLARKRMRALLREYDDLEIVGEASNGEEALEKIGSLRPKLVFLDVQMPEVDGFEVVRRLPDDVRPLIVFVTAYEQYALQAFQVSAVQYVLKPIGREELANAIARVRQLALAERDDASNTISELLAQLQRPKSFLQRVVVKSKGRTLLFRIEQVDWFESAGNYVRLHITANGGRERHLLRETMNSVEEKLDPRHFLRIHRSAIVNLERVRELQPTSHGEYIVVLSDDTRLTLSRVYRDRIEPLLGRL